MSHSVRPHRWQPTRLPHLWDSPGKSTGVDCHFLLQCMKSEKWEWSRSVVSDSSRPHGLQPTRLLHPWDFPGKSTGVGCHCLLRQWKLLTPKTFQQLTTWRFMILVAKTKSFILYLPTGMKSDGQGSLACCSPWGRKVRHDWMTEQQQWSQTSIVRGWLLSLEPGYRQLKIEGEQSGLGPRDKTQECCFWGVL